jgi:hypothetical protein
MIKYKMIILAIFLSINASVAQELYSKYKKIAAYEIRPEVVFYPRFTSDGMVCEIGIERLHYAENVVVDSQLNPNEIKSIIEELLPDERKEIIETKPSPIIQEIGNGFVITKEYDAVSISTIYEKLDKGFPKKHEKNVKANHILTIISWKNRKCN